MFRMVYAVCLALLSTACGSDLTGPASDSKPVVRGDSAALRVPTSGPNLSWSGEISCWWSGEDGGDPSFINCDDEVTCYEGSGGLYECDNGCYVSLGDPLAYDCDGEDGEDPGECDLDCEGDGGGGGTGGSGDPVRPSEIPEDYWNELNAAEKRVCKSNVAGCLRNMFIANDAIARSSAQALADGFDPNTQDFDGTKWNAMRHAYWQAILTWEFDYDYAKAWGDAHESEEPPGDAYMNQDLYNNEKGRQAGSGATFAGMGEGQRWDYIVGMANSNPPQLMNCPYPGC